MNTRPTTTAFTATPRFDGFGWFARLLREAAARRERRIARQVAAAQYTPPAHHVMPIDRSW